MDLHIEDDRIAVPTLTTDRLTLRMPRLPDAPLVADALNNLNVSRWLAVVPYPYGLSDAVWFIEECAKGTFHAWFIWDGDRFVGTIGIDGALGYWLAEPCWGQGYATEAGHAVVDHYFLTGHADSLGSGYFVGNTGSGNVLGKLGFEPTEVKAQHCLAQGKDLPSQRMLLTRARWAAHHDG